MTIATRSPEQVELKQKEALLQEKLNELTELELSLSTLQADLRAFEVEYYLKVGSKYVELDRLQATLDALLASKIPSDAKAQKRAAESRAKAEQTAHDAEQFQDVQQNRAEKFQPTDEVKTLYRELAKLLHPDLTLDPNEKERRHGLMQQINEAYQSGNLKKLQDIWEAEKNNPENIKGDDIGSSLVRTIRKIAQAEKRIVAVKEEIEQLHKTDLHVLFETVGKETEKGNDLIAKMSADLNSQIIFLQNQIEKVNR